MHAISRDRQRMNATHSQSHEEANTISFSFGTHAHCRATELRSYLRHTADRKLGGSGLVETVAGDDESGAR